MICRRIFFGLIEIKHGWMDIAHNRYGNVIHQTCKRCGLEREVRTSPNKYCGRQRLQFWWKYSNGTCSKPYGMGTVLPERVS